MRRSGNSWMKETDDWRRWGVWRMQGSESGADERTFDKQLLFDKYFWLLCCLIVVMHSHRMSDSTATVRTSLSHLSVPPHTLLPSCVHFLNTLHAEDTIRNGMYRSWWQELEARINAMMCLRSQFPLFGVLLCSSLETSWLLRNYQHTKLFIMGAMRIVWEWSPYRLLSKILSSIII